MAKLLLVCNGLLACLVLFLSTRTSSSAPTHNLRIGVKDGKVATLYISDEAGVTPRRYSKSRETTTTVGPAASQEDEVTKGPKPKYSHKKYDYHDTKEKSTLPATTTDIPATTLSGDALATIASAIPHNETSLSSVVNAQGDNQYVTPASTTASTPTNVVASKSTLQEVKRSEAFAADDTSAGTTPGATPATAGDTIATTGITAATIMGTQAAKTGRGRGGSDEGDVHNVGDDDGDDGDSGATDSDIEGDETQRRMTAAPPPLVILTAKPPSTEINPATAKVMITNTATTPVITTEVQFDTEAPATRINEKVATLRTDATTTSEERAEDVKDPTTMAHIKSNNSDVNDVATRLLVPSTLATPADGKAADTQGSHLAAATLAPVQKSEELKSSEEPQRDEELQMDEPYREDKVEDGPIKLIDLEKHDFKSVNVERKTQGQQKHEDGHDGVKKIKKKQLIDKHFIETTPITASPMDAMPAKPSSKRLSKKHTKSTNAPNTSSFLGVGATAPIKDISSETTTQDIRKGYQQYSATKFGKHFLGVTTVGGSTTEVSINAPEAVTISVSHPVNRQTVGTNSGQTIHETSAAPPTVISLADGSVRPIIKGEWVHAVENIASESVESQVHQTYFAEIIAPTRLVEQAATHQPPTVYTTTLLGEAEVSTLDAITKAAEESSETPVLSTTVFQVPDIQTTTTRLPPNKKYRPQAPSEKGPQMKQPMEGKEQIRAKNYKRVESKISDIQIEVYDSTVDSIVASTNFRETDSLYALPLESAVGTTKPPSSPLVERRFTQYVVDRTEASTQEPQAMAPLVLLASGKPEPAAIEIHINVSEGFGNESEDLEFSYRQPDYGGHINPHNLDNFSSSQRNSKVVVNPTEAKTVHSDEILVVEIIDTGENTTENSASAENVNPIFTFHSDADAGLELKDIKYYPQDVVVKPPQVTDELFMADVKKNQASEQHFPQPPALPPPPPRKPSPDRDSDTIFYISNTEVKVGESLPTTHTSFDAQQLKRLQFENQFFPADYVHTKAPKPERPQHRYEEDIILSPLSNTADALKIFRSPSNDGAPPLDVTYVGESVIEVEQSAGVGITTTPAAPPQAPDVIIQPAVLPEMSIGVPVIGELPPQIELKEIDFMPDEANQQRSGVYESDVEENLVNGNDVDRLVESSIQYGGDLIEDVAGGGGGFDGVERSYPFGNPAALRPRSKPNKAADYAHFSINHGVSNLRKDELSVDVSASDEISNTAGNAENSTLKDSSLLNKNGNETTLNITYAVAERMSNATAFAVMDDSAADGIGDAALRHKGAEVTDEELGFKNLYTLIIGLFVVLLPVVVTVSMFCGLRFLYSKYQLRSSNNNDKSPQQQPHGNAGTGETGESTQPTSPTKSEIDKDANKNSSDPSSKPSNSSSSSIVDENPKGNSNETKPKSILRAPRPRSDAHSDVFNSVLNSNYTGPNGSVTKMTLKNNHLIVETEERNDISRNARETKMIYNSAEKDGVFVVEVARGADSKIIPESPNGDVCEPRLNGFEVKQYPPLTTYKTEHERLEKLVKSHEKVQIHQPPPELPNVSSTTEELQRSLHQIEEVDEPNASPLAVIDSGKYVNGLMQNSSTGLSQSDLSSASSTDSNKRYSYGNQELYVLEQPGYATSTPTASMPYKAPPTDASQDEEDRKSENGHSLQHSPAQTNAVSSGMDDDNCNKLSEAEMHEDASQLNGLVETDNKEADTKAVIAMPDDVSQGTKLALDIEAVVEEAQSPESITQGEPRTNGIGLDVRDREIDAETANELAYDSLMSLPEPPTNEEIKQFADLTLIETNQLDSLPPPPPPAGPTSETADKSQTDKAYNATNDLLEQLKATVQQAHPTLTNGNSEKCNGHESTVLTTLPPPPPPLLIEVTNGGKLLPSQLTPPASPPPSPPPHFSNGLDVHAGICAPRPMAVVDVNGS